MNTAGFSPAGLERLEAAMASHVEGSDLPGVVTLVARGDQVHVTTAGFHRFGGGTAMRRDTLFRIASMTKPVTAAVTMMLVEDGTIRLDEPVDRLLPELADRRVLKRLDGPVDDTVPAERPILVEDLLTLRMGTGTIMAPGDYPINAAMIERGVAVGPWLPDAATGDAWIAALGELPLMHQPGTAWMYDTGITALGVLLERASGTPLGELYRERLFEPLGMADTGFRVPACGQDRLPVQYWRNFQTGVVEVFDPAGAGSRFARTPGFASAGGGLVSTADDYLAFARLMLRGGAHDGRRLLSERSVAAITTDHITAAQKARSPFGPGFWDQRGWGYGVSVVRHPVPGDPRGCGWDGGYGTSGYWDPATGIVGVLLTQRMMESPAPPPVFTDFWRVAYDAAA